MRSFEARWPAECPVCGDWWHQGDALWWQEEDVRPGTAVHWYCAPANSEEAEREGQIQRRIDNTRTVDREGQDCRGCGRQIQPGQMWELRGADPYHEECE